MPNATRALGLLALMTGLLSGCGSSTPSNNQTYTVSGNLTGLSSGTSIVLGVNGQSQTLTQSGGFTTALTLNTGASYSLAITSQPTGETCAVSNGSGTIASSNINNIQIACSPNPAQTYTIGGQLSGLNGSIVLQDNSGDNLSLSASGAFTFATPLVNQAAYNVSVLTQPVGQTCSLASAAGTVQGANVSNVAVSCTNNPPPTYTIGGSLVGLPSGDSVVLQDNGGNNLTLNNNGGFTFTTALGAQASYTVSVATQPTQVTCSVTSGTGTATANVTNVQVTCAVNAYSIGGTLSGLNSGTSVVLQNNGGDNLTLTNSGSFTFSQNVTAGQPYAATVLNQPAHQVCTVTNGSGTASATVSNVAVSCVAGPEYVYVANGGSSTVSQYTIGTNGALTAMSPATVATGSYPFYVTVDPSSRYVYVVNKNSNNVSQYTIGSNGALTPMSTATVAAGSSPSAMTIDPSGRYAYVVDYLKGPGAILQYTIGAGGALTPMSTASVATGLHPQFITVDPTGKYAYVVNNGDGTVSQYTIGSNGALTPMSPATVVAGTGTSYVTIDPTGQYAYVANISSNNVSQYTIGATGASTPMSPATVMAGYSPVSVTVDPTGKYAYVANLNGHNVSQYTIGTNGALTPMASPNTTVPAGSNPFTITTDPSGQYVYMTNGGDDTVSQYTIGAGGVLTPMSTPTAMAGSGPTGIAVAQP